MNKHKCSFNVSPLWIVLKAIVSGGNVAVARSSLDHQLARTLYECQRVARVNRESLCITKSNELLRSYTIHLKYHNTHKKRNSLHHYLFTISNPQTFNSTLSTPFWAINIQNVNFWRTIIEVIEIGFNTKISLIFAEIF